MKIYKYIGVALMVLALGACKTDDLERDIDALKDRVTAMEAKVDRLNESMNMIRVALDGNKTIQSYTENEDGSYTLTLSDGNTITLTQGKIGTIDEYQEVSISSNGNWVIGGVETEHRAVAADGEPGVTPKFRLTMESEGKYYWEVSYDGELTWEEVKSQQGTRVYASASGSSSVAGPIASAVPNATGDKFEITLTGSGTKYEIPIVPGLACAITKPTLEEGFWIVPTNTGATTSIDLKGEAVLISAPEGWTVTASINNSNPTTLSVTPPNQDEAEGVIILQVHKGLHWAIDQIKVRSKKVITSWYQEFLAGGEIVVNDVPIKKGSADNKVVINGEEVDLTVTSITTDNNTGITADGLYFIEAGLDVVYSNTGTGNKILINDSPTGVKPVVTCSNNNFVLKDANFLCKNVKLILEGNKEFLSVTNVASSVMFDGCYIDIPSTSAQCFLNTEKAVINDFYIRNSCFNIMRANSYYMLNVKATTETNVVFPKVRVENSKFYSAAPLTDFRLVSVHNNNGIDKNIGVKTLSLKQNTFLDVSGRFNGMINGTVENATVEKNIFYMGKAIANVTIFRVRALLSDALICTGSFSDNIGYIADAYTLKLWHGQTSPLDGATDVTVLQESPFESLLEPSGTYVLKPEYQGYGATIE